MAAQADDVKLSEIAVHWQEEELIQPPPAFIAQANMADPAAFERFGPRNWPDSFREYAELLDWDQYWHTTVDTSNPPFYNWWVGGRLNASYNCVDRHLAEHRNKAALIFVPEPEDEPHEAVTYQELWVRVNEFAAVLREAGLKAGDRVTLHMPMVPELPVTMLACARLGVVHSQVFGGFSGAACGDRIVDSESRVLITSDAYWRAGRLIDHKGKADIAVRRAAEAGHTVDKVLVWRRYPGQFHSETPMTGGRDYFVDDLLAEHRGERVDPVSLPSEAPLFIMYTSGTTAMPKGCQHSTGGYMSYVAGTTQVLPGYSP